MWRRDEGRHVAGLHVLDEDGQKVEVTAVDRTPTRSGR